MRIGVDLIKRVWKELGEKWMIERDDKRDTILGGRVDSFLYGIVEWADISFEANDKTRIMIKSGGKIKLMIIKIG